MPVPEPTTWTIHLAARHPGRAVLALLVIIFALFALHAMGASPVLLVLIAGFFVIAIADFLFPIHYRLDAQGAHIRTLGNHRVLPWAQVRRVYLRGNGIKLSPLAVRGWAESYRGILLRTPDRAPVLATVRTWLTAAGVAPEIEEEP
ncbi:MAG TPA: hypothetical protein VGL77_04360 [Armatimonadota bacterium]|jgi:hypothetical protein